MNIAQLKEYIKDLPDDMEILLEDFWEKTQIIPTIEGKKLIFL